MYASAKSLSRNLAGAAGTLLFAGLCIAGATTPASAQIAYSASQTGHMVAVVSHTDLDLGSAPGRARLENRLRTASKQVCRGTAIQHWASSEEYKCFRQTLKAARSATMAAFAADKTTG